MSKQAEAGKGSKPRKEQDREAYANNWDVIFGKKKAEEPPKEKKDGTS